MSLIGAARSALEVLAELPLALGLRGGVVACLLQAVPELLTRVAVEDAQPEGDHRGRQRQSEVTTGAGSAHPTRSDPAEGLDGRRALGGRGAGVVEDITRSGGSASFLPSDLAARPAAVRAFAAAAAEALGGDVDVLVHNAAYCPAGVSLPVDGGIGRTRVG